MEKQLFKYGKDIVWSLPILFQYEPVWVAIKKLYREFGVELPQVNGYGCCAMKWTGGRMANLRGELAPGFLSQIYAYCKENDITPSLAFNSTNIAKEDLEDRYSNYILDMSLEIGAHFIVYSDLLYNHIKEKEPNAYMVASVTQAQLKFQGENRKNWSVENETNLYNELLKKYDLVVVRPEYSMGPLVENPALIDDISKIEALINQRCIPDCPRIKDHYKAVENAILNPSEWNFKCILDETPKNLKFLTNCVSHSREAVQKLVDSGVKHLKLQGRGIELATKSMALNLFMRIFEVEGANYHILDRLLGNAAEQEVENFIEAINS